MCVTSAYAPQSGLAVDVRSEPVDELRSFEIQTKVHGPLLIIGDRELAKRKQNLKYCTGRP